MLMVALQNEVETSFKLNNVSTTYYINTIDIPGELSRKHATSSHEISDKSRLS